MNFQDAVSILSRGQPVNFDDAVKILLPEKSKWTRFERQRCIESVVHAFCPDAIETKEIFYALMAGLQERYGLGMLTDVLHEARQLEEALDELDKTKSESDIRDWISEQDLEDQRAREAGL